MGPMRTHALPNIRLNVEDSDLDIDNILSGARGILVDTVSTTRGMAERGLKRNGWKIYMFWGDRAARGRAP
jgi:hypothetical protein